MERTRMIKMLLPDLRHPRNPRSLLQLHALAILVIALFLSTVHAAEPQRFTFAEIHMGAAWKIVLYAADETVAKHAADAAYARIEELNHILSDYDSESELSRLSATSPSPQPV